MNLNQLAKEITKHEGLKKQVDIAQVKEIIRVIIEIICADKSGAAVECLNEAIHRKKEKEWCVAVAAKKKKRKAKKK